MVLLLTVTPSFQPVWLIHVPNTNLADWNCKSGFVPTAISRARLNTTKSPANPTPTKSLNQGRILSFRHATMLNTVKRAVMPRYTRNCTHGSLPPVHSGSNMSFMLRTKLVMKATCEAVSVHHPNVLIQAQRYEPKRPVGVFQRRRTQ